MKHQAKLPTAHTRQAVISPSSGDAELVIRSLNWMIEDCERIDRRLRGLAPELRSRAAWLRKIAAAVDDATGRRMSDITDAFTPHGRLRDQVERIVAYLRRGKNVSPQMVIGPVVWQPKDDGRFWYFVVATGDDDGPHFDQLGSLERHLAEELRTALFLALIEERSIVLHNLDNELQMARLCEALWPSEKTSRVRAGIKAEQAAARGAVH